MLTISKEDPTKLAVVGKPAKVPADFPNTVAASTKNGLACVGASGAVAGITCAPFTKRGLGAFDKLRAIDLGQTTPPLGPLNTVSHSFFSEDEATLFTTVKGDPTVGKAGFLSSLQIEETASCRGAKRRAAAAQDLRSTPEGTNVLFGSQVIPGTGKVFATDASFGAAVLQVDRATGQAVVAGKTAIEGQAATCWAAFAPATGTVFVTDVAVPRIVEMSADDAGVVAQLDLSPDAPDAGFTDLLASGNFLYALAPGNGTMDAAIVVVDIAGGPGSAKFLQRFSLEGLGGANAQGIAILN
ncbi:hypothetical protein GGS23DRAFT_573987 [Durotheca rogersii]|uniref:uncharacterized protein n=1 Tax=Durotheca rogersii TaxID=419775 RepID=UPI00221FED6D|nr:uncharacterized protein GGS23DRAFT_573987 [Durotheca rogersii]KAI5861968.1 hypothetical protein GGS23DRAFT_573987 [Durotheca rogersii]